MKIKIKRLTPRTETAAQAKERVEHVGEGFIKLWEAYAKFRTGWGKETLTFCRMAAFDFYCKGWDKKCN